MKRVCWPRTGGVDVDAEGEGERGGEADRGGERPGGGEGLLKEQEGTMQPESGVFILKSGADRGRRTGASEALPRTGPRSKGDRRSTRYEVTKRFARELGGQASGHSLLNAGICSASDLQRAGERLAREMERHSSTMCHVCSSLTRSRPEEGKEDGTNHGCRTCSLECSILHSISRHMPLSSLYSLPHHSTLQSIR